MYRNGKWERTLKFDGAALVLAAKFAGHVVVDTPEIRGLRYQASRSLRKDADDLLEFKFTNGQWTMAYGRDAEDTSIEPTSALARYSAARLAALDEAMSEFATRPITVSVAAFLLDTIPDFIRARILDSSLEGTVANRQASTTLAALVRFLERNHHPRSSHRLDPSLTI